MRNRISFCLLVVGCVNSFGQTNSSLPSAKLLSIPVLALRVATLEQETSMAWSQITETTRSKSETQFSQADLTLTLDSPDAKQAPPPEPLSAEARERAIMLKYYERLKQTGYLTRPEPPSEPESKPE